MKIKPNNLALAVFSACILCSNPVSASWLFSHGHSGHLENETTSNFARKGYGLEVFPQFADSTWVHFSVPSNGDSNAGARYVRLEFTVDHAVDSRISRVDIYNGNLLVKSFLNLNLHTPGFQIKLLDLGNIKQFRRGMGVSVEITAGPDSGIDQFTFNGVGANFVTTP